ncbi:Nuclear pore complex protein [Toxocara canis]|uniref:Nuclear pore complex protein n=1 Tax=Toxocara canis TaxID=6265 RepID=A0A0B2VGY4_TOXCA|nr:Nuclear pore complex protein [Toxocara canis]
MWMRARNIFDELSKFAAASGKLSESQTTQLLEVIFTNSTLLTNVLSNAGKSAAHRAELEPNKIVRLSNGHSVQMDAEMRNEAIIISDTFNCDELDALELIACAETQSHHFGNWPRGLCAIVCYYDTHRFLSAAMKVLVQLNFCDGVMLTSAMSTFLKQFCANPAFAKRLIEVTQMNIASEMQMLHRPNVNGLGGPKHQQLLCTLLEETITNCRDALYMLCSSWNEECAPPFLLDLLAPLRELKPNSAFTNAHLFAWTAVLILMSPQNMSSMRNATALVDSLQKELKGAWSDVCVLASLQLAYAVSCAWVNANRSVSEGESLALPDEDEVSGLLKKALNAMVLPFLRRCVIKAPGFREDTSAFHALDTLIKLFIVHFSDKLVLLRRECEEELSSIEVVLKHGLVPNPALHFEKLLNLIADLYDCDSAVTVSAATQFLSVESPALSRFLRSGKEISSPVLQIAYLDMVKNLCKNREMATFIVKLMSTPHRDTQYLSRFLRSGKEISSPVLQIAYLDMVKNLCKNREMATFIVKLMSTPHRATADTVSFSHFCWAIRSYLNAFRRKRLPEVAADKAFKMKLEMGEQLPHEEVAGLIAWTQLAAVVALHDPYCRRQFASGGMFMMESMVGLLASAIPLVLKGAFYRFLSVLAMDSVIAEKIWTLLKTNSVLTTSPDGKLLGIQQELNERECSFRSYDSTLGFLHLMRSLMLHPTKTFDDGQIIPYLRFVIKSVISQFLYRSYEHEEQMWELCSVSCETLCNLLKYYVVTDASLLDSHPQVIVLAQVLSKSPVFRSIAGVLVKGSVEFENCAAHRNEALQTCCLSVLRLLHTCMSQHASLAEAIRSVKSTMLIASLDSLLLDGLSDGSENTYLSAVASFVMRVRAFCCTLIASLDSLLLDGLSDGSENTYLSAVASFVMRVRAFCCTLIASLDSLLLDGLSDGSENTYLSAVASFVMRGEQMPLHAYWAAHILRELCASRPAVQSEIVYSLKVMGRCFVEQCARMTSPKITSLALSPFDAPVLYDVESLSCCRVRGETARILIELCTTAVEMGPSNPNMAYFLCDFDMSNLLGTRLENPGINGTTRSCLHSVVDTLEMLADSRQPYALPCSALFEPMLRFLLRLVSGDESCGELVLRFLRSNHDLVFRLVSSHAVISSDWCVDGEESVVVENIQRMVQGYVLHLCAIELSSLLKIRHYSQPARFYRFLLSSNSVPFTTSLSNIDSEHSLAGVLQGASSVNMHTDSRTTAPESLSNVATAATADRDPSASTDRIQEQSAEQSPSSPSNFIATRMASSPIRVASAFATTSGAHSSIDFSNTGERLLWRFLRQVKVDLTLPQKPHLEMFNSEKLDNMVSLCDRVTTSNVAQCDIERMHWLLQREALWVVAEMRQQGVNNITNEMHEVLRYCVAYNLLRGAKASAQQLLSGWISVVNVMAAFVPVPFISSSQQADFLSDALRLLLTEYGLESAVNAQVSVAMSQCMCSLINAACYLYVTSACAELSLRRSIAEMLNELIRCVVSPGSPSYQNKYDVYLCILRLLNSAAPKLDSKEGAIEKEQEENTDLLDLDRPRADPIKAVISLYSYELVKLVRDDICSSRLDLKVVSLLCMARLLREDSLGSQSLAHVFVRSGLLRCVLESLAKTCITGAETVADLHFLEHLQAVLVLLISVAMSESGWKGLFEEHALEVLAALPIWMAPPKQAYTAEKGNGRIAELYMEIVELKIRLCLGVCASPRWRCISDKAVCLIARSSELLNHLMRNDPHCPVVQMCAVFLSRIYTLEESSKGYIESTCLNALRTVPIDNLGVLQQSASAEKPSFNTPRKLFTTY